MDGVEKFATIVFGLFIVGLVLLGITKQAAQKEVAVACYKAATVNPNIKCTQNER